MSQKTIHVKKRNGRLEELNVNKINRCVQRSCENLEGVSVSQIVLDAKLQLFDKITTEEIDKALILTARSEIYKEPNYSYVASRMLLNTLYKEVFGEGVDSDTFILQYKKTFISNVKKMVKEGILDPRCLNFDLKRLADNIITERDLIFKYHGIQNIYDRYLLRLGENVVETPQAFYMRVAMGLSFDELNPNDRAIEFYNLYSQHLSSPSTPTLFNSATSHPQLSSCFLNTFGDSIDGIFEGLWQEARKSKYAGGLGFDVTCWRASGARVKGTDGKSSGIIPWLKVYNDMLIAVDQGGRRPGSGCAYLETWHLDIEDFLELRRNSGEERRRTHDMNTANWVPDLFMDRVKKDEEWTLFCPNDCMDLHETFGEEFNKRYLAYEKKAKNGEIVRFKTVKAKDLWKKMLKMLFETSSPWITWKDPSNIRYSNQHEGIVHSSNLCTEILLHTKASGYKDGVKTEIGETAVCNLHSINLSSHVTNGKIDYDKLSKSIFSTIRALDNVIDLNFYPTQETKHSNTKHRPIGMGTMGWHDLYHKLNILYDSDEGVKVSDQLMEFISYNAIMASSELAKERGKYSTYEGSLWSKGIFPIDSWKEFHKYRGTKEVNMDSKMDWTKVRDHVKKYGMRNSNTMAIAPTASISYQHCCEQSIEPNFSVLFIYENKSGNYYIINEYFVNDMKKLGKWNESFAELVKAADGDIQLLNGNVPEELKRKYSTCFNRDMFKLVDCAAMRQKWIDQSQSFNLYNGQNSLKYLNDIYMYCWEKGIKTTYYLRNKPATKAEKSHVDVIQMTTDNADEEPKVCNLGEACESCQ